MLPAKYRIEEARCVLELLVPIRQVVFVPFSRQYVTINKLVVMSAAAPLRLEQTCFHDLLVL